MNRKVLSNAGWLLGSATTQAIIAFASNLVAVRFISPGEFGEFAYSLAVITLVMSLFNLRLGDLITRTRRELVDRAFLGKVFYLNFIQTIASGLISLAALLILGFFDHYSLFILAGLLLANWSSVQIKLFEKEFAYGKLSVIDTSSQGISHIFLIIACFLGFGILGLYARNALRVLAIVVILKCKRIWTPVQLNFVNPPKLNIRELRIGGLWFDGILEQSVDRFVTIFIANAMGNEAAGFFFQAKRLIMIPIQFASPVISRLSFNYFSNVISDHRLEAVLLKSVGIAAAACSIFAVAVVFFADPAVILLLGTDWAPVSAIAVSLIGFVFGLIVLELLKGYFYAKMRVWSLIWYGRVPLLTTLALGATAMLKFADPSTWHWGALLSGAYTAIVMFLLILVKIKRGFTRNVES